MQESKVEVGGGVARGRREHLHQQVVGDDQACLSPLLDATPVISICSKLELF